MPVFRAAAAANNNLSVITTNAVCTIPSSAQVGDLMVFITSQNSGTSIITAPDVSWTSISGPDNNPNNNLRTQIWIRYVTAGQPGNNVTFVSNVSGRLLGAMSVFSAADNPLSYVKNNTYLGTANANHTIPTLTTPVDSTAICVFAAVRTAAVGPGPTISTPTGYTADTISSTNFVDSPNYSIRAMHLTTPGAAGSYGGQTSTTSIAATDNMYTLGILPVSADTGMQMFIVQGGIELPITLDRV